MIPRIIHYTWFSDDAMPPHIQACIESWRRMCPGWQLRKWDMDSTAAIDNIFMREAIAKRKWAFAADVVRLHAVYRHGGVYLDTDMLLDKPLDPLTAHRAFIGRERTLHIVGRRTEHRLTAHCLGAEAAHPFIGRCLQYYEGRRFVTGTCPDLPLTLRLDMRPMALILCEIARQWGYNPSALKAEAMQQLPDGLAVYPPTAFDPRRPSSASYGWHLALGSWREYQGPRTQRGWLHALNRSAARLLIPVLDRLGYEVIRRN